MRSSWMPATRRELAREQARRARSEAPAESVQPHRVQDFVGREAEFRTISEHLGGASRDGVPRTVIVAGPPGVGKTALAIEATQRLREPGSLPLFLDLLGPNPALARPALSVLQALLREVFDVEDGDPPSTMDACVAKWQAACAKQDRLIVLDNAAEEAQIRPVLAGGSVRVVATSRRSLAGLEDVERIHLDPLPSPDSIRLLRDIVPPGQRTDLRRYRAGSAVQRPPAGAAHRWQPNRKPALAHCGRLCPTAPLRRPAATCAGGRGSVR